MKTESKMTRRNSNLELMRILLMFGIIAHHYVVNSGVEQMYDFSRFSWEMLFLQVFAMFGKTGINCFTLITGYFMVRSNITLKKFLRMYLEVKFYYVGCYLIFVAAGYEKFSVLGLKMALFNVLYELNWLYTGTYLVFLLLIPILNVIARRVSRKQYAYVLAAGFVYYTVISTFTGADTFSYLGWMAVMYLLGGYLSLHGSALPFYGSLRFALRGLLVTIALMCAGILAVDVWGWRLGFTDYYYFLHDSHKILALSASVFLFLTFLNLRIPQSVWINRIASSTFGVLLIHSNGGAVRRFLWQDVFDVQASFSRGGIGVVLWAVFAVCMVFVVTTVIDQIRVRWIETPFFRWLGSKKWMIRAEEKADGIWNTGKEEKE